MRRLQKNEEVRKQNCSQNNSKMTREELIKQNLKTKTDSESKSKITKLLPQVINFMKEI